MDVNLLDGGWYADDPHAVWDWMRRESPVHYDEVADVWGIARYDDVLAIEKDPKTFSSQRAPRPHGTPLPMMISMDDPEHQRRRSLVNRGFTPRRIGELEDTVAALCRRIVDRVIEAGACDAVWDIAAPAAPAGDRRAPRLRGGALRRPAPLVRRHDPGHHPGSAGRGRRRRPAGDARLPGAAAGGHRRPAGRAPRRPHQHPLCRRDRRRAPRRRVDRPGDAAAADRRRRDVPPRDHGRPAGPPRAPRPAGGVGRGPGPAARSRGGAAALGVADQEHGPHGDDRSRTAGPAAPRGRPGHALLPVGQPGRRRCSTGPTNWT